MIEKQTETVMLSDFIEITVSENDWGMSRKLNRLKAEMNASVNGDSSALGYFKKNFYPMLAAVSSGDVPDADQAFSLPHTKLDEWWLAVWRTNPDWFIDPAPTEFNSEVITLRDGSTLELVEAKGRPSFLIRVAELEEHAELYPQAEEEDRLFQAVFYPKMAGCMIGHVPAENDMRDWPTAETNKVYEAAKRMNPDWFFALDVISEQAQAVAEKKSE